MCDVHPLLDLLARIRQKSRMSGFTPWIFFNASICFHRLCIFQADYVFIHIETEDQQQIKRQRLAVSHQQICYSAKCDSNMHRGHKFHFFSVAYFGVCRCWCFAELHLFDVISEEARCLLQTIMHFVSMLLWKNIWGRRKYWCGVGNTRGNQ